MFWVIQKEVHAKSLNLDIIEVLNRLSLKYIEVEVSNNQISEDLSNITEPIMINGSIMLSNIAKKENWFAGKLFNENFNYTVWSEKYSNYLLNKNAIVSTLGDAKPIGEEFFARPVLDNKTFNGKIFTKNEFIKFQEESNNGNKKYPNKDIEIILSPKKNIGQEHRHYIVDGKVASSSRYKFNNIPNFKEGCDDRIIEKVYEILEQWQPSRLFVLDTYIYGDEIGIVELGFLPHAGIYDADLMKIINEIDNMNVDNTLILKNKM